MIATARQRRIGLTDKQLAAKKRRSKRYIQADPEQRGLYVRIPPDGPIAFAAVARDPYGKQVWATLGTTADMKINEARERAREAIRRIKDGQKADRATKAQAGERGRGGRELAAPSCREEQAPYSRRNAAAGREVYPALLA